MTPARVGKDACVGMALSLWFVGFTSRLEAGISEQEYQPPQVWDEGEDVEEESQVDFPGTGEEPAQAHTQAYLQSGEYGVGGTRLHGERPLSLRSPGGGLLVGEACWILEGECFCQLLLKCHAGDRTDGFGRACHELDGREDDDLDDRQSVADWQKAESDGHADLDAYHGQEESGQRKSICQLPARKSQDLTGDEGQDNEPCQPGVACAQEDDPTNGAGLINVPQFVEEFGEPEGEGGAVPQGQRDVRGPTG